MHYLRRQCACSFAMTKFAFYGISQSYCLLHRTEQPPSSFLLPPPTHTTGYYLKTCNIIITTFICSRGSRDSRPQVPTYVTGGAPDTKSGSSVGLLPQLISTIFRHSSVQNSNRNPVLQEGQFILSLMLPPDATETPVFTHPFRCETSQYRSSLYLSLAQRGFFATFHCRINRGGHSTLKSERACLSAV